MKHRTHHLFVLALALGLAAAGANAAAIDFSAPPTQNSAVFNDAFTAIPPISDGTSMFASNQTGPSFENQSRSSTPQAVMSDGKPHAYKFDFGNEGERGFHEENMQVSPVPEPSEYALLVCGLCLIGYFAYRRRPDQEFLSA